ncbi:MAG: hypothetical protein U1E25_16065 [Methylocystis sp.]
MIRDNVARALLFDLDQAIQSLTTRSRRRRSCLRQLSGSITISSAWAEA